MKHIIDLKDYYPKDITPLINLIKDVKSYSLNPNSFGVSYLYLINDEEIWVLTSNPHYVKNMSIGVLNPLTLKMGIDIMSSAALINIRYDGTVDKVLLNKRPKNLIKIIEENVKAIEEARSLIGL